MISRKIMLCGVLSLVLGNALCMSPDADSGVLGKFRNLRISSLKTSVEDQKLYDNLAPTLAIMKMFLKDDFKPLPEGLKDNVRAFFSSGKFTPRNDGQQKIILDEELTDILCNLIAQEQKEALNGNVTLYHGMKGSNLFVYKYFARLFSHLTGQDLGDVVLRGDHLYAENPKTGRLFETLRELKDSYEFKNDYDRGLDVSALQCNIALSVGPRASLSTASSVGFFCNSSSAMDCRVSQLIVPALMLQGMSIADARESAAKAEDFFNKYFSDLGGSLLAISLPVENADKLAKHIWMGGEEYDHVVTSEVYSNYKQFLGSYDSRYVGYDLIEIMKLIKSINENMSNEEVFEKFKGSCFSWNVDKNKLAEQLKHFSSLRSSDRSSVSYLLENLKNSLNKDLSKEDVYFLTNEMHLYLHPEMKAKIFGTFRHPLLKEEAKSLDKKIDELAASHAELIINSKNKPVEGSFVVPRKVVPNESMSYRIDLLPIFIERGRLTEAKQIIDEHPDFLENVEIARLVLSNTLKALYDNYDEVLEFIETNCGINKLLSKIPEDELYPFLHMFSRKNTNKAIGKLLKSSEIKDDRVLSDLISGFLRSHVEPVLSLTSIFEGKQLSQQVIEKVLSRIKFGEGSVDVKFFKMNEFSFDPNEKEGRKHLEELLKIREENPRHFYFVEEVLNSYGVNKENYPQLAEFLDNSDNKYNCEEKDKLRSYLKSEEVDKEEKKSRVRQLPQWDQFSKIEHWLDYGDKNQRSLGEELSKEVEYPGMSMTIFDAREMYKKYVL